MVARHRAVRTPSASPPLRAGTRRAVRGYARILCIAALGLCPLTSAIAGGSGDSATMRDLKSMSLEQLLDVEVTSVSKRPEKLLEAPAAIQVITSDDIRRSAATTIPAALRLANNLDIAPGRCPSVGH